LPAGEVKETQQNPGLPRYVCKPDLEGTAATVTDAHVPDLPFHQDLGAGFQVGDWHHPGAVLIAQRQMEQQVLGRGNTNLGELLRDSRTHATECPHRYQV